MTHRLTHMLHTYIIVRSIENNEGDSSDRSKDRHDGDRFDGAGSERLRSSAADQGRHQLGADHDAGQHPDHGAQPG